MLGIDKLLHLAAGFFIYTLATFTASSLAINLPSWIIFAIVVIAGIAKEIFDKLTNGDAEVADVLATSIGGLLGLVVMNGLWLIE